MNEKSTLFFGILNISTEKEVQLLKKIQAYTNFFDCYYLHMFNFYFVNIIIKIIWTFLNFIHFIFLK